jgi:hypothetical protein
MRRLVPGAILAAAVAAILALSGLAPAGANISLPGSLSTTPEPWTPNIFAGTTTTSVCDQWFGSGGCGNATVYSTAVVNGEVIVAGAFTEACQPGPGSSGHCAAGTEVTRDDLFAYQLGTGTIDPNFIPQLNQGPVYSVVAGPDDTVYIGGAFTTVNGVSEQGVAQLDVTPGVAATDGSVVATFNASVTNGNNNAFVQAMAYNGNALYIGGQFATVDGTSDQGDARLNATTGAVDPDFSMPVSDTPASGQALKVEAMSLTGNGSVLAIAGPFLEVNGQSRPRVALINTGGGYGDTATLGNWAAPILANNCSAEHDYVRGIDFSPSGNDLVIADTGYKSSPVKSASVCDAAAQFPTAQTGTNVAPLWVNYTGGDSFYSVQDTGAVVYLGGHNRLSNNECGNNAVCEANAVLNMGFTAIDANTGLTMPWFQPLTLRGNGTMSLTTLPAGTTSLPNGGILIGNDVTENAGAYHSFNALFPVASTATSPTFGSIPSGLFSQGRIGGYDEGGTSGTAAMCVTGSGTAGTTVQFSTCDNGPAQNWTVQSDGNIEVNGLCLDTVGEGTASGTSVDVNTCGSSGTQVWTQGTGNTLVNQASERCLTDSGSKVTNGTVLKITACPTGTPPANQVWPLPAAPAPSSLTPDGPVYSPEFTSGGADGQPNCLTETGGSTKPGALVEISTCIGGTTQRVTVQPAATAGTFNLVLNGLCLDTVGEGVSSGTDIFLNTCGSEPTQVWTQSANGQALVNQGAAGMCLDDPSTTSDTDVTIVTCSSGTQAQEWWLPTM